MTERPQSAWLQVAGVALALCGSALFLFAVWDSTLNHDIEWYLTSTRRWLEGGRLYIDIVEINPPLNFYLTVPPLFLSDLTGLTESNAQFVVFSGILLISLWWSSQILLRSKMLSPPRLLLFQLGLWVFVIVTALPSLGQRDHLFIIFALPWLIGHLVAPLPTGNPVPRAAWASIGICLKPHFILLPVFVTLWQIWRQRSWRPVIDRSNLLFLGVGLAYIAAVWRLYPEYFEAVVPLGLQTYGAYGFEPEKVLMRRGWLVPLITATGLLLAARAKHRPDGFGLWITATLAGLSTYLVQWTGFYYQTAPLMALSGLALFWVVTAQPAWTIGKGVCLLGGLLVLLQSAAFGLYRNPVVPDLAEHLGARDSLVVYSDYVHAGPPLARSTGAIWASRYPAIWPLPGALNRLSQLDCQREEKECARLERIRDQVRGEMIDDLVKFAPDTVVMDPLPGYIDGPKFDWMRFLEQDPRFRSEFAKYELEFSTKRFDVYRRQR